MKLSFDFISYWNYHLSQKYSLKKEPFAKAIGIKGGNQQELVVWDATCGTGKDSILLLFFGCRVFSFERSPFVLALLQDSLRRAEADPTMGQIFKDKFKIIGNCPKKIAYHDSPPPDVIYLDPMYPEKRKTRMPRKEMRILKELVGNDSDFQELFLWALATAKKRVVVKRALHAPEIFSNVTAVYKGKSTRYDMYRI